MDAWTIKRTADWMTGDLAQRGVEGARLDAELILAAALDVRRVDLYLDFQRPLQPDELDVVRALFKRRRAREPMAYLLGYRDFYRERFTVTPDVLIPRPDSEVLVDQALKALEGRAEARHVDVCTGSGCVGLSIAKARADEGKRTTLTLTDLSPAAL
ncbi:MAG: HemK/PrmC family methyltransferase, partial [Myxococcota bacterium]